MPHNRGTVALLRQISWPERDTGLGKISFNGKRTVIMTTTFGRTDGGRHGLHRTVRTVPGVASSRTRSISLGLVGLVGLVVLVISAWGGISLMSVRRSASVPMRLLHGSGTSAMAYWL
jgi:hypothetical protein